MGGETGTQRPNHVDRGCNRIVHVIKEDPKHAAAAGAATTAVTMQSHLIAKPYQLTLQEQLPPPDDEQPQLLDSKKTEGAPKVYTCAMLGSVSTLRRLYISISRVAMQPPMEWPWGRRAGKACNVD